MKLMLKVNQVYQIGSSHKRHLQNAVGWYPTYSEGTACLYIMVFVLLRNGTDIVMLRWFLACMAFLQFLGAFTQ